jgi:hypothetical protein
MNTRSAAARLAGSWSFMRPRFMVFERGSSTARMRRRPMRWRKPSTVVRMAVG